VLTSNVHTGQIRLEELFACFGRKNKICALLRRGQSRRHYEGDQQAIAPAKPASHIDVDNTHR